jgi:hypothetical protein
MLSFESITIVSSLPRRLLSNPTRSCRLCRDAFFQIHHDSLIVAENPFPNLYPHFIFCKNFFRSQTLTPLFSGGTFRARSWKLCQRCPVRCNTALEKIVWIYHDSILEFKYSFHFFHDLFFALSRFGFFTNFYVSPRCFWLLKWGWKNFLTSMILLFFTAVLSFDTSR